MDIVRKNIKIPSDIWRLLRMIAASTGEQQLQVLRRLLTREWELLQTADRERSSS